MAATALIGVKSGIYLFPVTNSSNRNNPTQPKERRARRGVRFREPEAHVAYLFRKLSRLLRASRSAPDAETVHQLRTTSRRLQTLAASLGEDESKAFVKFDKILSDIFEKAGKVRDLDVQMEALKSISLPSVEDDKAVLRNYLQRQRAKRQRKLSDEVEKETTKRLPKRQRRAKALLVEAVAHAGNGAPRRVVDLRKEIIPFLEKLRANNFNDETLHEVRLDVKHVRYAAEAAGEAGREVVAMLKPVQDAIGEWHDWANLVITADQVLGPLPGHPLMTILRGKVRGRFNNALTALKPLEIRLSEIMNLPTAKRPGPVLIVPEQQMAASAG